MARSNNKLVDTMNSVKNTIEKSPRLMKLNKNKRMRLISLVLVSSLLMVLLALAVIVYVVYMVVTNVFLVQESFKPAVDSEAEDDRIRDYYINEDVHVDQKSILQKFVALLC
jgi:cytoskeletal protein RodZ